LRHFGSPLTMLTRSLRIYRREGMAGIRLRVAILHRGGGDDAAAAALEREYWQYGRIESPPAGFRPLVSVIVPNYNHAPYLRARLDAIYGQTYDHIEVILLDDCSTDGSLAILEEYAQRHPDKTRLVANRENSGGVFRQWAKGFALASGELIWVAESDDYCTPNLVAELVRFFVNPALMLAYCRSDFVSGDPPQRVWTTEEYLNGLGLPLDRPFVRSAHWLVNNAWAIKNIVPNASSALFRHPGRLALFDDPLWHGTRLCGDWIFYLTLIRGGLVGYSPHATNAYRQHPNNTSVRAQREDIYYREHELVCRYISRLYRLQPGVLDRQREQLCYHWRATRGTDPEGEIDRIYDIGRGAETASERRPNIAMVAFALIAGGGETFPVMLANLLKARGHAVTFLNWHQRPTEPGVRNSLDRGMPLLELSNHDLLPDVLADLGIELIHSHHAWVDVAVATLLGGQSPIRHVVTSHGMYEMLEPGNLANSLAVLTPCVDRFVYVADKNLLPFSAEFRAAKHFVRIDNAVAATPPVPIDRAALGLTPDDFVLCLVSRAIPEKGWSEAIAAVEWARSHSRRSIQLLLIGDGPEYDRLRAEPARAGIHLLGFRANPRDYFAAADMGFLPTRFTGESAPLVLLECLHAGRPMLVSEVGEIAAMLATAEGPAGALFGLDNWQVPVERLGALIADLAQDEDACRRLTARVPAAAARFDPAAMVGKYEAVYADCLGSNAAEHSRQ
jgi:glycosyltransferase involved in cell wall biosynthesis